MFEYQIDDFMDYCVNKGLSKKTYKSYEKTIVLFTVFLKNENQLSSFKEVKEEHIVNYIEYIRERGKYTVVCSENSKKYNYPDRRKDLGERISDVTVNNYIRNLKVFFNYLTETRYIKRNPMSRVNQIKVLRKPLYYLDDKEYKKLINSLDISKFSEYRDRIIIMTLSIRV